MSSAIRVFDNGSKRAEIFQDEDPESPRSWDNLGVMVCFHKRYNLGDESGLSDSQFESWAELEAYLKEEKNAVAIFPLYLYDHSGLRIKIGSFAGLLPQGHAEFDSGQVGFIYVSREKLLQEYGAKKLSQALIKKAWAVLKGEVETYDQYLSGDVWGYKIFEVKPKCKTCGNESEEETDSCWGFYGLDYIESEVKSLIGLDKKEVKHNGKSK